MKVKKILIANRSEIAFRVLKTCQYLKIKTVVIYSEEDKNLEYVQKADESYSLGSGELSDTYLNQDKIVKIAKDSKADAIHPGYGFLSENASFAEKVENAGILFIGPTAKVISLMGDKIQSKIKAQELGVPVIPGYHGEDQSLKKLESEALKIGFPVLIKASAGGGGKGMRIVREQKDFQEALESAKSEARKAFSNDKVLLEKYITAPKHIEVQVVGDGKKNFLHFFERECSIQRRYQKIIEECPSPSLTESKRQEICQTAVKLAEGIQYRGAGTVELVYDQVSSDFYFLEMNTRLQVEHPVTEMSTHVDLVKLQIDVANDCLKLQQNDISLHGHSIECRIYAEDPKNQFLPQSGTIGFIGGESYPWYRVETAYRDGDEVSINYDPMIAKLVTWGESRSEAIEKMKKVLDETPFLGVVNNRDFLLKILNEKDFQKSSFTTHYIEEHIDNLLKEESLPEELFFLLDEIKKIPKGLGKNSKTKAFTDPWDSIKL
ncbi:MAG: ATP-grasp domain-containing protein [Halobacteriovoraceae bacterium]|nr:ATP-grasp domain-containing protein [Halobacteriovoraceae bacterium]MCB9093852.1 ATP-grasp domain-containing protein [Halobacteriovoraceae bacterium]